jgi:hypothetical protein
MGSWGEAAYGQDLVEQTAVLAALSFWDYAFVANVPASDAYKATGRCISVAAGRISYTYGFKGKPYIIPPSLFQHQRAGEEICCLLSSGGGEVFFIRLLLLRQGQGERYPRLEDVYKIPETLGFETFTISLPR